MVLVNKADGALMSAAMHTKGDYGGAMQFIQRKRTFWTPPVLALSASTGLNMEEVERQIREFHRLSCETGSLQRCRAIQRVHWMWGATRRKLVTLLETHPEVQKLAGELEMSVRNGTLTPSAAATCLLEAYHCAHR